MIIWQDCITLANEWWKRGERAGTWKPKALFSACLSEVNKLLGQSQARTRSARQKATLASTPKKLKLSAETMLLKATNKRKHFSIHATRQSGGMKHQYLPGRMLKAWTKRF